MTIKQFQELYYVATSEDLDFDKSIKMVGIVTKKTPEQVEAMSMIRFNLLCARVHNEFKIFEKDLLKSNPRKIVRVGKKFYRINYDVTKAKASTYVEVATFSTDVIENLHKLMASIVTPIKFRWGKWVETEHEDLAKEMESMDFEAAYHSAVFFYTLFNVSMQVIQPYLISEMTKKGITKEKATEVLMTSQSILDGFTMPRWSQTSKQYLYNRFGI
jgi:hypothetical protein